MLREDIIIEAKSPEGHDIALAVFAGTAVDEGRTDGCCTAALVDRTTGEIREQIVSLDRLAPRWQETAARKMGRVPVDMQTPLTLVPSAR